MIRIEVHSPPAKSSDFPPFNTTILISKDTGAVVCETDRILPLSEAPNVCGSGAKAATTADPPVGGEEDDDAEEEEDEVEPTKVVEEVATFDEILVWGHEQVPGEEDVFVRGVQEWLAFAKAMHSVGEKKEAAAPHTP